MKITLYQGDCLQEIKKIPDKSVDLVLTDPPYNIGKADWDKIEGYDDWCADWLAECARVLKDNGSLYLWHNDMPQIAALMERIKKDGLFDYVSFCIWDKTEDYRARTWKNRRENKLRSWFNRCEYCLEFVKKDDKGIRNRLLKENLLKDIQDYFIQERNKSGLSMEKIKKILGQRSPHYFTKSEGWRFPSKEQYMKLQKIEGCFEKPYELLESEIKEAEKDASDIRYYHKCDEKHCNVWTRPVLNASQKESGHPCEKPVDLLARIIRVSCRPGGTVLDLFMGGGSTGVAAVQENRDFIGIEQDERWFLKAKERIDWETVRPKQETFL